MTTYLYDLICPRCGRESMIHTESRDEAPPPVKCGECLMEHVEVVEMKIVRVFVGVNS
jgi:hypothetical protein